MLTLFQDFYVHNLAVIPLINYYFESLVILAHVFLFGDAKILQRLESQLASLLLGQPLPTVLVVRLEYLVDLICDLIKLGYNREWLHASYYSFVDVGSEGYEIAFVVAKVPRPG